MTTIAAAEVPDIHNAGSEGATTSETVIGGGDEWVENPGDEGVNSEEVVLEEVI